MDRLFTDMASGKDTQRPELERLLAFVRKGDTMVVHSMDRLARNLDDLHRLVQKLTQRGVRIEFVKESLTLANRQRREQHQAVQQSGNGWTRKPGQQAERQILPKDRGQKAGDFRLPEGG